MIFIMKQILRTVILCTMLLSLSGHIFAQKVDSLSRSEKRYDAGKAMVYVGGGTALAGLTFSVITMLDDNSGRDVNIGPFVGYITAGLGGIVALAGIPVMLSGRASMRNDGGIMMTFSDDYAKGFATVLELGAGLPYIKPSAGVGYNFSDNIYLGASVAGCCDWFGSLDLDCVPVYADARFSFGNKRVAPYIGANVGYDVLNSGIYTALNYGVRIKKPNQKSWWIASNVEYAPKSGSVYSIGMKFSYMLF